MSDEDDSHSIALDAARHLAEHGVPIFLAEPSLDHDGEWLSDGGHHGTGYWLPKGWVQTTADPAVADRWRPGMALCAVMGHAVDLLDVDPHKGGSESLETLQRPTSYGRALTPSGGTHDLIAPLGVRSLDGVLPGVDVKAGQDGEGYGFAFIAPTRKRSKVTGETGRYEWLTPPDLTTLSLIGGDNSGATLAQMIRDRRTPTEHDGPEYDGPAYADLSSDLQRRADRYVEATRSSWRTRLAAAAEWPDGETDDRGRGWEALARDAAWSVALLAVCPWTPLGEAEAEEAFHALPPVSMAAHSVWAEKWRDDLLAKAADRPVEPPPWTVPFDAVEVDRGCCGPPEGDDSDEFDKAVEKEAQRLRVLEAARELVARERRPAAEPWDAGTLAELVTRPPDPPHRVDGLIPWEADTAIIAQRKTGKTTLALDLAGCLLTGDPFLGSLTVLPVEGSVGFLNFEVSAATITRWATRRGIPSERLFVVNLRGSSNPLADDTRRAELAALLRGQAVEALIVDPFGAAFSGESQNDAGQVRRWLDDLSRFARKDVGALDLVLTVHAGWSDDGRARGSSAIEDWYDSGIFLTAQETNDQQDVFLRAKGRDIEWPEDRLEFDPAEGRLTLTGSGSRQQAKRTRANLHLDAAVMDAVSTAPGIKTSEIEAAVRDEGIRFQKGDVSKAASRLEAAGLLRRERGPRNSTLHHATEGGSTHANGQ